jgi:hypothetical protein
MPIFSCSTIVRGGTEDISLSLTARHILLIGNPSKKVHAIKGRLPVNICSEVLPESSQIRLVLEGTVNKRKVKTSNVQKSALANHLVSYLRTVCARLSATLDSLDVFVH